jgi:predicted amidohydrolase
VAKTGAGMIAVPSAFTRPTGEAHWETLLRARAIENGAFVLAPAQGGEHADGRETWGRSMVVDPWGAIVAQSSGDDPGVIFARLDLEAVNRARRAIPALRHEREFAGP